MVTRLRAPLDAVQNATALVVCADEALRATIEAVLSDAMTSDRLNGGRALKVVSLETPQEARRVLRDTSLAAIVVAGAYRDPACDAFLQECERLAAPVVVVCTTPLSVHVAEDLDLVYVPAPFDVDELLRAIDDANYRSIERSGIR